MQITRVSRLSGKVSTREIDVDARRYELWRSGTDKRMIQDAFPHLSAEDREFILSGITPEEWAAAFG